MLRTRNLHLELDDTNGVGTCGALAQTILSGTGWSIGQIDRFYESDGVTEKVRTLKSPLKTGAYQMIINLCTLFNARPFFNGETKTVDIRVFNPFSGSANPDITLIEDMEKVFELNYGHAMGNISRKPDTSSLVTRLNVEGEYGDDGYVGIEKAQGNDLKLNFLVDFSYFQSLGLFTQTHQDALDEYLSDISIVRQAMSTTIQALLEDESSLNDKWGSCQYGCFDIVSIVSNNRVNLSPVYTNVEGDPMVANGQKIALLNTDGTYVYATISSGTMNYVTLNENVANIAHTKAIIFFTPASGVIGGKESALEAAKKTRATGLEDLRDLAPDYTHLFVQENEPASYVVESDIWVQTNVSPMPVYTRKGGVWDAKATGRAARYAVVVADSGIRIDNLTNGTQESVGLYTLMAEADSLVRSIKFLYDEYDGLSTTANEIENSFIAVMGDMLRDGYWNDSNYVEGQEDQLYNDAKEIMREMAQPVVTYDIGVSDLHEQADTTSPLQIGDSAIADIAASIDNGELIIDIPSDVVGVSFPYLLRDTGGYLVSNQSGEGMKLSFSLEDGYLIVDAGEYGGEVL